MGRRPALVVAGTHSSCGKTTVALGLSAAFREMGLSVQTFKAGPDYLDAGHLAQVSARPCRNLDTWMLSPDTVRSLFEQNTRGVDISLIEGVMGLHDGRRGEGRSASTAELSSLLGVPILLVIDAQGIGRSVVAVTHGYSRFDRAIKVSGVILNKISSEGHFRLLKEELEGDGIRVYGGLPKDRRLSISERHLGLVSAEEHQTTDALDALLPLMKKHFDLPGLLSLARGGGPVEEPSPPPTQAPVAVRVAYALDESFHFYYEDGLDMLRVHGAELIPFSPLHDETLPKGTQAIYIGGGYPELHAAALSENLPLRKEIQEAVGSGLPVYAECGGLMYLMESLIDKDGRENKMVGAFGGKTVMGTKRRALGYCHVRVQRDTIILPSGADVRAHEYHYSHLEGASDGFAYEVRKAPGDEPDGDGLTRERALASYVHLNFAGLPLAAERFVEAAKK